ncbi:hypothetical protein I553_9336 [Mycobacterium xenopi 4042]|uniref:Uncharacterized protein n=1 Tax=Mycobacterium xenopi 4042 TaxID=1299334 RepID=X8E023_MYCXE|nr:hypothetical protein I553_9336 [Mycobacterium xenopi 4042]
MESGRAAGTAAAVRVLDAVGEGRCATLLESCCALDEVG